MNLFRAWLHRNANNPPDATERIDGERDNTNVNQGDSIQHRMTKSAITLIVLVIVAYGAYLYYADYFEQQRAAREEKKDTPVMATVLPPLVRPHFPDSTPAAAAPPQLTEQYNSAGAGATAAVPPPLSPAELRFQRQMSAPLSFLSAAGTSGSSAALGGEGAAGSAGAAGGSGGSGGATGQFTSIKAFMMPNPSMIVSRGTGIPCTVRPAIDTTLSGMVTCVQSADVYSADNKVLLLPRLTKWVGGQAVGLQQGMQRIGMIWQRPETPDHVILNLNTGSGDALGRPGINGDVNTHFWRRIGEAAAISFIADVGSYISATQKSGSNNTTIAFPSTTTGVPSVMSEMVKKSLDIPDVMTKNQGAEIIIYIQNEDLDFSNVYALRAIQ